MSNDFAVLSPYLVPTSMPKKRVNVGDGFILRAIERLLGSFAADRILTSRAAPDRDAIQRLGSFRAVIMGGANQLDDGFNLWPSANISELRRTAIRCVPFGIGLDGQPKKNAGFTDTAKEAIEFIHERVEFSSWRCPVTVRLLEGSFPKLRGRFLMTGCPVVYDKPLLEGAAFSDRTDNIAVTVTDRGDFWEREAGTLQTVAALFPKARKWLVLHQVFEKTTSFELRLGGSRLGQFFLSDRGRLRTIARELGYEVVAPIEVDACLAFYEKIDLHIGSRLHAHLNMLSQNKRSFLTRVEGDERSTGFSEFLGFPLVEYRNIASHLDFDFEIVRRNAITSYEVMRTFVNSLERLAQVPN